MKTVNVIAPEGHEDAGTVHTIPEADLASFQENGWEPESGEKEYADMSVKQLKALLAERNIEAEGKKEDLIAALEAADESTK